MKQATLSSHFIDGKKGQRRALILSCTKPRPADAGLHHYCIVWSSLNLGLEDIVSLSSQMCPLTFAGFFWGGGGELVEGRSFHDKWREEDGQWVYTQNVLVAFHSTWLLRGTHKNVPGKGRS